MENIFLVWYLLPGSKNWNYEPFETLTAAEKYAEWLVSDGDETRVEIRHMGPNGKNQLIKEY